MKCNHCGKSQGDIVVVEFSNRFFEVEVGSIITVTPECGHGKQKLCRVCREAGVKCHVFGCQNESLLKTHQGDESC